MNFRDLFLVSLLLLAFASKAQNTKKVLEQLYLDAEEAFYNEDFETALSYFNELIRRTRKVEKDVHYRAEVCSLMVLDRHKSLDKFLSYEEDHENTDKFYFYWKGKILLRQHKFEESRQAFDRFLGLTTYTSKLIRKEAEQWKKWAGNAMNHVNNPKDHEIHNLEINTKFDELSPVYFNKDEDLLFFSNRIGIGKGKIYNIFHSAHKGNNKWTNSIRIPNFPAYPSEDAHIEVTGDVQGTLKKGKLFMLGNGGKNLFYSINNSDEYHTAWSAPKPFDVNLNTLNMGSHFFVSGKEDRIIFAMEKSPDNLDLYEIKKNASGSWGNPKPLEGKINGIHNEDSPFLTEDGKTLYFSSDGHESIGGYDLFKSVYDERSGQWEEPENLGSPLNTVDDETHLSLNSDKKSGYFASNRHGSIGGFDIYFFWESDYNNFSYKDVSKDLNISSRLDNLLDELGISDEDKEQYVTTGGKSSEASTGSVSAVSQRKRSTNPSRSRRKLSMRERLRQGNTSGSGGGASNPTGKRQSLLQKHSAQKASARSTGNQNSTAKVEDIDTHELEIERKSDIKQISSKFREEETVVASHIFFDFATASLTDDSREELEELFEVMKNNPRIKLEIDGHTDNIEIRKYGISLSQDRADAVKKWVVDKGIASTRLRAKGFGAQYPIVSNDDEADGRELNRRIELKVIE